MLSFGINIVMSVVILLSIGIDMDKFRCNDDCEHCDLFLSLDECGYTYNNLTDDKV